MPIRHSFAALAAAAFIASLTSGCAVGPDYARPVVALPDHFQAEAAVEQRKAPVQADLVAWWGGFGDPELTRYVKLALSQDLDLAQAAARVAQVRAGLGAADAALLPHGDVSAQAGAAYQSIQTPLGQVLNSTPGFDRRGHLDEADLGASWEVDVFGGLRREREAALAQYQGSQAAEAAARLAVAAETADTYITVRELQARLDVAHKQVQTEQDLLQKVKLLEGKGLAATLQVRQAEGALAEVRATVPVLESALESGMNALDVMLGDAPGTHRAELTAPGIIPRAPQIAGIGSPAELLRRRPDLIVAERRLAASNAHIGVAVAEYYPKFSLDGLIGSATSVSGSQLFSNGASQASGVLGLHWRLFDFGRINAQIDQAKGREAEMLAAYRLAALRATEDVEDAFTELVEHEAQAAELDAAVGSLTGARNASFAAYQGGVVSLIEVLHADEGVLRASDARSQAQAQSARAAVAAFKALGGGWQPGLPEQLAYSPPGRDAR